MTYQRGTIESTGDQTPKTPGTLNKMEKMDSQISAQMAKGNQSQTIDLAETARNEGSQ